MLSRKDAEFSSTRTRHSHTEFMGTNVFVKVLLVALLCIAAGSANGAQEFGTGSDRLVGYGFFGRIAAERGGDDLIQANDGRGGTVRLSAGDGTVFEVGLRLDWRLRERPAWETEFALGIKQTTRAIGGGELAFERFSVSAIQFYRFTAGVRLGAGVVTHMASEIEAEGTGFNTMSAQIGTGAGPVLMIDYGWSSGWSVGMRAVSISHTDGSKTFDATSGGIYLSFQQR